MNFSQRNLIRRLPNQSERRGVRCAREHVYSDLRGRRGVFCIHVAQCQELGHVLGGTEGRVSCVSCVSVDVCGCVSLTHC